ncbi:MAG: glycogen/starch/alpha-glucan phosphorylase [Pseudomonadota bacterium]
MLTPQPLDAQALKEALKDDVLGHLSRSLGVLAEDATANDWCRAMTLALRDRMAAIWLASEAATRETGAKRVYYLSMEFLIGRLLQDGVVNLGLMEAAERVAEDLGFDLGASLHAEPDAALGNGGLGRLAACFLESLSSLGCPAMGYGIRYEHGLFAQSIEGGRQAEAPETWLSAGNPWEFPRPALRLPVGFGGAVRETGKTAVWTPGETVEARAYDLAIVGWQGAFANALRLWEARASLSQGDGFDLEPFNAGDYLGATEPEALARTISRVLYPDDSTETGKTLRLKQEYFFTAASLADILARFTTEHGTDLSLLPRKVAIQLNDTHPAIAGPELVRLLMDAHGRSFEEAVGLAQATLNYTNHTLLPEALEAWPEALMASLLPRHMQLIERIDASHAKAHPNRKAKALDHGQVRMGELSFIMANRVNGVSALHTDLMRSTVFADLDRLHPERIVNQTNGVTPRRWIRGCNPRLAALIDGAIGPDWTGDLERLSDLESHTSDAGFLEELGRVKAANKADLAAYVAETGGPALDPSWMFDVQIKRIHEYKRQHMNILEAIALWHEMRDSPGKAWQPRVKIIAGKAAPGYFFAKDIIRLIHDAAHVINADPATRDMLQIAFLPNYNVTLAERLIPASDLSEQISTAGKEASGTGNMKFALNGALTIGTLDGANVEIRERVRPENFFLFGMTAEEAEARRTKAGHAKAAIAADPRLARAIASIRDGVFSPGEKTRYAGVVENLTAHDYFLVCSDFSDYWRAQREVDAAFAETATWRQMAGLNIARSGWFSSDRTIRGYMADIWRAESVL